MEENNINPAANAVVESQITEVNTNGVPGSLPGETPAETRYRLRVDGEDVEVDLEELKRGYAHNRAAGKRLEEAAMTRKEAESVLRLFKSNPREAFSRLGMDAREFAETVINEHIEDSLMDPRDRELREYKSQVEQYEAQRRAAEEAYQKETMEAELSQQVEAIQTDIVGVLDTAGLPKTERTVSRMVYYMQSALAAGYNVQAADVVEQVRKDYIQDFKSMIGGLSEDQIEMFLGEDVVRRMAASTVKRDRKPAPVPRSVNEGREIRQNDQKKPRSPREFFSKGF